MKHCWHNSYFRSVFKLSYTPPLDITCTFFFLGGPVLPKMGFAEYIFSIFIMDESKVIGQAFVYCVLGLNVLFFNRRDFDWMCVYLLYEWCMFLLVEGVLSGWFFCVWSWTLLPHSWDCHVIWAVFGKWDDFSFELHIFNHLLTTVNEKKYINISVTPYSMVINGGN